MTKLLFIKKNTAPFVVLVFLALLAGCSTGWTARPEVTETPRTESHAISQTEKTALGAALAPAAGRHPGQSGFLLLPNGSASLEMRLALVQAAEKTLDLQYYAMNDDTTANLLLEAILQAAARGVRVRFLIDNLNIDEVEEMLSVLDGNKNIQIRVFNPMVTRKQSLPMRVVGLFTDFSQMTKRMHNKSLISDNQLAIIGGRNLGDEYFGEDAETSFNDLDILSAGPVTAKISHSFDKYWNDENAFPIAALRKPDRTSGEVEATRAKLKHHWEDTLQSEAGRKMLDTHLVRRLQDGKVRLVWAAAGLAVDEPAKIAAGEEEKSGEKDSKPLAHMTGLVDQGTQEFVAVSAYLVPQEGGTEWLTGLVRRGMKVRILTNSLASTDVVPVHTGYRRYREALVKGGVELYELKPTNNERPRQRLIGSKTPPTANLHAKVYVIDRKDVMVGSFNFDPRSVDLNTEISLVIHSAELAAQVLAIFDDQTLPENSYRVTLDGDGDLVWLTEEKGKKKNYSRDPKAGVGRTIEVFFLSLLPIEGQL